MHKDCTMSAIEEYLELVDHLYGVYLDSTTGFDLVKKSMEDSQKNTLKMLKEKYPELANQEHQDTTAMIYGKGDPNTPEAVELHRCTQGQYKLRNSEAGDNFKFIGNMCLISLYQYWEDHYRSKVASLFQMPKNELKAPIFGDLRLLRRSIVHHAGIALKEIEKSEVLKWYKEGDDIFVSKSQFEDVIYRLKALMLSYKQQVINQQCPVRFLHTLKTVKK